MQESIPSRVRSRMKPGGISLRFEKRTLDGETVYLHHYVVPKGRSQDYETYTTQKPPSGPITRDEITPGPILKISPFFVDAFIEEGGAWRQLHSLSYWDAGITDTILVKYLQPRLRHGPILLLSRRQPHYLGWILLGFPDGIRKEKSFVQQFVSFGEGDYYAMQKFEKTDPRGYLLVEEESREGEESQPQRVTYRWDGERFSDPQARWFVIAAASKRKEEMDAYLERKQLIGTVEVTRSDRFPRLAPGLWMVIIERCRTQKAAIESVSLRRQAGLDCYAKRAF
jgi:hypothetical protein